MSVEFRTVVVNVPSAAGPRTIQSTAAFGSTVLRAGVALNGFGLAYTNDRNLRVVQADTDIVSIAGSVVTFKVDCDLADNSGNDPYSGFVTALVTAEVT